MSAGGGRPQIVNLKFCVMIAQIVSSTDPNFLQDVPDVLYKYRNINDDNHKKLLYNRELYFSRISQFNDPFDGTLPYRFDHSQLTPDNIFKKYYELTKYYHPSWNDEQIHNECYALQNKGLMEDPKHLEQSEKNALDELERQFGIACLCKSNNNFLLWSHYANNHTGFAIGFDKKKLFEDTQAHFAHMQYQEELPKLDLFEDTETHFSKVIGTKSKMWEYEEEYRLTKIGKAGKITTLQKETIVEVILGCKMLHPQKMEVIEFLGREYPHVRCSEMQLSKTHYTLKTMRLL